MADITKQYLESFVEKKDGKMLAIASDETVDRQGDLLSIDRWDFGNFMKNPVLQLSHNYSEPPVGIAKNLSIRGKRLYFEPVFHEITQKAKEIKQLYEAGIMKAFSVGFIPPKDKSGKYELLEISAVAIPANPNALIISSKAVDAKTVKEVSAWVCKMVNGKIECPKQNDKRWNKSLPMAFNKDFDISKVDSIPANFDFEMFTKFFECQVKDIFVNNFFISSPLLGNYLSAFKQVFSEMELADTRNFTPSGSEFPPQYEVIQLTASEKSEFLIEGTQFYKKEGKNKIALVYSPNWGGLTISLVNSQSEKEFNKELLEKVKIWATENNKLKGQKFALSGEFLEQTNESFDSVILEEDTKNSITKTINALKTNKDFTSRGLMFVGKPGTGKTKTGRIIMSEAKEQTFIWVSSKDFFKIGEIGALRLSFQIARELAPSILFMEDIDSWLKGGWAIDLLKTEMDGLKQNKGVVTILTSNTPEEFPDALLDRPGRFHDVLNFSLPNSENRKKILSLYIGEASKSIGNEVMNPIIEQTEGYSAAHMKELVDFAKMVMQEENIDIGQALLKSLEKLKKQKLLIDEIKKEKSMNGEIKEKSIEEALKLKEEALKITKEQVKDLDIKKLKEEARFEKAISKSPKCRIKDEPEDACRSRKISEMIDEGYEKDQAAAIAYDLCAVSCEEKAMPKEGDECKMDDGSMGMMKPDKDGNMVCMPNIKTEHQEGEECTMDDGTMGEMHPDDAGHMVCMKKKAVKAQSDMLKNLLSDMSVEDFKKEVEKLSDEEKEAFLLELKDFLEEKAGAEISDDGEDEEEKGGPGSGRHPEGGSKPKNPSMRRLRRLLSKLETTKYGTKLPLPVKDKLKVLAEWNSLFNKEVEQGKILTKNQRDSLTGLKKQLEQTVTAIDDLLDAVAISGEDKQDIKVGEPKVADKSNQKVILRALQTIAKNSNFALNKIKKESK